MSASTAETRLVHCGDACKSQPEYRAEIYGKTQTDVGQFVTGWFAVRRGITSHPLFKGKPERLAVWMWLLDNAAWKETKHDVAGRTVTVPRGSVCASERHIAKECGIGYQVVRTAIKRFKAEHMINAEPTHGKNIITLCNYDKYQSADGGGNAAPNAPLTQEQRTANAQKEQGNKGTRFKKEDTNVSLFDPSPANDAAKAVSVYNDAAEAVSWPKVQRLNPNRSKHLRQRIKEAGGIDGWIVAIGKAKDSDFLCARTQRPWTGFSFDWLVKAANFTKLMEGNYDNRDNQGGNSGGSDAALERIARLAGLGEE